jgi:CRISPR/Cas system CSM-associated protein Csm4 (group 5 of RAMP superfamily)
LFDWAERERQEKKTTLKKITAFMIKHFSRWYLNATDQEYDIS